MKVEVIFEKPRDITTPGLDGTVIRYPFAVRYIREGALRDDISHHSVDVSISGTLSSIWGFGRFGDSGDALVKTLFQFGLQHINDKLQVGELEVKDRIDLRTNTFPTNPFELTEISSPAGFTSQIEVKEEQPPLPDLPPPTMKQPVASEEPVEIQQSLQRFRENHPDPEKAAFLMMQYSKTPAHDKIVAVIRKTLRPYDIEVLRADDKEYHDDLFPNIVTYLYGCSFGIAVFERIEADDFNPNVSLEIGYMLALRKPVCLAMDRTLKGLHTDLVGKLYKVFDSHDPQGTIPPELLKWLRDKNLIEETDERPRPSHEYQCEYFGLNDDIRSFSLEASDFGAKSQVMRMYEDGTADIQFVYEGEFPNELFDQLAKKYRLHPGLKPEEGV